MGTILIVEDEDSVNRGITFTLEKEGYQVYSCGKIYEAERVFRENKPDLLICDINLPDGNGLDFVREVRNAGSTYIICLTARDGEMDFVMGYEAGADDYIDKPFSLSVLTLKVNAFFQRISEKNRETIVSGNILVSLNELKAWVNETEISFTRNEWKLLRLFLQHPKQILTKNQILEQIFDTEGDFVDENTIAVNIRRLREKIEPDLSDPCYIKNIRGIGYIWNMQCEWK